MKKTSNLSLLEELCSKLSIIVKYDKFFGKGGYCRLRDKSYFIINERLSSDAKEQIFIKEMSTFDMQNVPLLSKLRELLERKCS